MKIKYLPLFLSLFALVPCGAVQAQTPTTATTDETTVTALSNTPSHFDPATMWRIADLRPGMKGYGLTVFSGLRPEKFDAEVVGVAHGFYPGQDIVWCRLSHPVLKDIGVVAGMSGSPIYIEGKLVGAVAYGYSLSIEPMTGVTPIEDMLRVYDSVPDAVDKITSTPLEEGSALTVFNNFLASYNKPTLQPVALPGANGQATDFAPLSPEQRKAYNIPDNAECKPLSTPLFVSGISPRGLDILRRSIPNAEVIPMSGGANAGVEKGMNAENVPGGPVGDKQKFADEVAGGYTLAVPLVEGDASLDGIGTVTWRSGNRLVGFGHPMFGSGPSRLPMGAGRIISVAKTIDRPFKMGYAMQQFGMLLQDRIPAVGGLFDAQANYFNASVDVDDPDYKGKKRFDFRIWADRNYGPLLYMITCLDVFNVGTHTEGNVAIHYDTSLSFSDGTVLAVKDGFASGDGATVTPILGVYEKLGLIMNNPWKHVLPTTATVSVRIADKLQQAEIHSATLDKYQYHAGDTVNLTIRIDPYRQAPIYEETSFTLPQSLENGTYKINIVNAQSRLAMDNSRNPALRSPQNYEQLINLLRQYRAADNIYVVVQDNEKGLTINGVEMQGLPEVTASSIRGATDAAKVMPLQGRFIVDNAIKTNCYISSSYNLPLTVIDKDK